MRMGKASVGALAGAAVGLAVVVGLVVAEGSDQPGRSDDQDRSDLSGSSPAALPVLADGRSVGAEPDGAVDYVGPLVFEVTAPLDALGGEGRAWSVGREVDPDRLAALASALGVVSAVDESDEGWEMVDGHRRLRVQRQPGLPWSYTTAAPPNMSSPPPSPMPVVPVPAPIGEKEAEAVAVEVAVAAGVGVEQAAMRIDRAHRSQWVGFEPEVDGLATLGMSTSVLVGPGGQVEQASGYLAVPNPGAAFPLLDAHAGLERLSRVQPIPLDGGREALVVEVTGVHRTLQFVPAPGTDRAWLVPAYAYETAEGSPWDLPTVIAVTDDHLAEPSDPAPPVPAPKDTRRCVDTGVGAENAPGDQVPGVKLCLDGRPAVGEEAVFELVATDADSDIRNDCASPFVAFGDGEPRAVCLIGCTSRGEGADELRRTFEHVYAEPGFYRVTVSLEGCRPDYRVTLAFPLTVVP